MRISLFLVCVLATVCASAICDFESLAQSTKKRQVPTPPRENQSSPPENLIQTEYDKFKDQTAVNMGPMQLISSSPGRLELALLFTYDGKVLSLPQEDVAIQFISTASERLFSSNHILLALLDGERLRFGEMKYDVRASGNSYVETMFMVIDRNTLLTVANSKKAEFELGHVELSLSDTQLALLRKFAQMMVATATGNKPFLEVISLEVTPNSHVPGNSEISGDVVNVSGQLLESVAPYIKCRLANGNLHDAYIVEIGKAYQSEITLMPNQCAHFHGQLAGQATSCEVIFKKGVSSVVPSTINLREKTPAERNNCNANTP